MTWLRRVGALVWVVSTAGCLMFSGRHWDDARRTTIEPINSILHKHLPKNISQRNLEAVLDLYATDVGGGLSWNDPVEATGDDAAGRYLLWEGPAESESIRARYEALFFWFETIDKTDVRIHRVLWRDRDALGYPADVRWIVRGRSASGARRKLDQRGRLHIDKRDGAWVVTDEVITSRELVESDRPQFEIVTERTGIDDVHDLTGAPVFRLVGKVSAGSGSAVGDFNCDGWEDMALLSPQKLRLYANDAAPGTAERRFEDVTAAFGLPRDLDIAGTGLVFFDADNDGDQDLWVCGARGERFYRNEGCRRFTDVTTRAGVAADGVWCSMPIVADYDRDGFLDVYIVRMGDHERSAPKPNWEARNGVPDTLYRNDGDGTFSDVTAEAGIEDRGWGLAGAWGDYNADGWPDVYVGNEFGQNALYRNDGDGTFTDVAKQAGVLDRGAAMGVAWGDYDNDGDIDLFVNNMYANSRWALFHPEFPPPIPWYFTWLPRKDVDAITEELTRGSSLLRNNGDGTFTDVSDAAGVRDCQWGWAAEFLDYDNDGRLDIYCVNGFVSGPIPDDV